MSFAAGKMMMSGRSYRAAVLADSPVAYWRLGEASGTTAADEMGSYPGTYVDTPTLGVAGAVADGNTAVTCNGSSEWVDAGDILDSVFSGSGKSFTIEAWFKTTSTSATPAAIFGKYGYGTEDQREIALLIVSQKIRFAWFGLLDANDVYGIESSGTFSTSDWNHIAITFDASKTRANKAIIYLNGATGQTSYVNIGTGTTIQNGTARVGIAAFLKSTGAGQSPFAGSIDEVAVYNKALSAADISRHHNAR